MLSWRTEEGECWVHVADILAKREFEGSDDEEISVGIALMLRLFAGLILCGWNLSDTSAV